REWILLLARRKLALLRESEPVWLPDYALAESKPLQVVSLLALGLALAKELSGEAELAQARQYATLCQNSESGPGASNGGTAHITCKESRRLYMDVTEQRFKGIKRCC